MAGISHDLRSPLTSILAYVDGLLDGVAQTDEARHKYLLTIKGKAEEIQQMVSQMFLSSKMSLEEYPLHPEPLTLDTFIPEFLQEVGPGYAAQGLEVSARLCHAAILADPVELRRLLTNLLDNCAKYKTGPVGHAELLLQATPTGWQLTLQDDGPGVPEADLPRLFEVFYRTDRARRDPQQGSGLGLAIAARAVQQMGGSIRAKNSPTGGLAVIITLPKQEKTHAENTDY